MQINEFDASKYSGKSDFFDLVQGDNKLRIVSHFAQRYSHFENRKYLGPCTQQDSCPHCVAGNKPSVKFLCHIIDRKDGVLKVAQFGPAILKQLQSLSKDPQYAFTVVPSWDCNIKKAGQGLETEYVVLADRMDTPLTEEETKAIALLKNPQMIVDAMDKKSFSKTTTSGDVKSDTSNEAGEEEIKVEDIPF